MSQVGPALAQDSARQHKRRQEKQADERGGLGELASAMPPSPKISHPEARNLRPVGPTSSGLAATKSLWPQARWIFRSKMSSWRWNFQARAVDSGTTVRVPQ
jgi:hypothetical protein